MKKFVLAVLSASMMLAVSATAFADDTELTANVPAAQYTLNIPASQEIEFGATDTNIGNVTVTDTKYFAVDKNLNVTVTYDDFKSSSTDRTLPFVLQSEDDTIDGNYPDTKRLITLNNGDVMTFLGKEDTTTDSQIITGNSNNYYKRTTFMDELHLIIESKNWARLPMGEYKTTITFTAEVSYPD